MSPPPGREGVPRVMKASAQWGCLWGWGEAWEKKTLPLSRRVQVGEVWLWGCPLPWPGGAPAGSQQRPPDGLCLLGGAPASTAGELGQVGHPEVG